METNVAPPTVILDDEQREEEEGEGRKGEGGDKEYVVNSNAPLAPPTSDSSTILPSSDNDTNQPEGIYEKAA